MKKLIFLVLFVMVSVTGTAQKLARINLEEVIMAMPEYTEMTANLELYSRELRENLETIQVELNNKMNDYQKARATMSETARQLKEREITDIQARLNEYYSSAQEDLQTKEQELTEPIITRAQDAVKKVAVQRGLTAVFNTAIPTMVYYDESAMIDLSADVKKELGI